MQVDGHQLEKGQEFQEGSFI